MARSFSGTDQISFPDDARYSGLSAITVAMWLFHASAPNNVSPLEKWPNVTADQEFMFKTTQSGTAALRWIVGNTAGNTVVAVDGTAYPNNTWVHFLGDYAASDGVATLYRNGVQAGQATAASPSAIRNGTAPVILSSPNQGRWLGAFAEAAIWTRRLDAAERAALAAGYAPKFFARGRVWYVDGIRPIFDWHGLAATVTGTTPQAHPRMAYLRRRSLVAVPAAAGVTLAGTVAAVSTMAAALRVEKRLGGTVAGASAMTAGLRVEKRLAGQVAGVSTMTAALQVGGAPPVVPVPFVPAFRRRRR